jgi:hypothetical protein
MSDIIKAGIIYSILVFLVGSLLGTIRELYLVPRFGPDLAVLIELPVILAISWNACGIVLRHVPVPAAVGPRLVMGIVALGLLLLAEMALATIGFGQTMTTVVAQYATAPGAVGLAGQVLFGLIPIARLAADRNVSD